MPQEQAVESQTRSRELDARGQGAALRAQRQQRRIMQLLLGAITVVIVAIVLVLVVLDQSTSTSAGSSLQAITTPAAYAPSTNLLSVGSKAPDFDLATVDGTHYKLSSMRGSTVFLEYFAIWCPICHAEAPTINQIEQRFVPKGLKLFTTVSSPFGPDYETKGDRRPANKDDVAWYIRTYGLKNPVLIDPSFSNVNTMLGSGFPTIYVIDARGIVRYAKSGAIPYSELAAAIDLANA